MPGSESTLTHMAEKSWPPSQAPPPGATPCSISATFTSGCFDSSYAHDSPVPRV